MREILAAGGVRDGDSSVSYNSRQNLRLVGVGIELIVTDMRGISNNFGQMHLMLTVKDWMI